MSTYSAHATAFYRDVALNKRVWTIKDEGGYPAPLSENEGKRVQPFWSSKSRVEKIVATVPAYAGFKAVELALDVFLERWIPGLAGDELLVGVNWSGSSAKGFDVEPHAVKEMIEIRIRELSLGQD